MKIGYLGPEASFTHSATIKAFNNEKLIAYHSIPACLKAYENKEIDYAIVPIENTIEGMVNTTIDYLFFQKLINIQAELVLPINQQLMINKKNINEVNNISKILSHYQALAQSQLFLTDNYLNVSLEQTSSTALAAKYVSDNPNEVIACIASKNSAIMYNLEIINDNIQDIKENYTRFWVLSNKKLSLNHLHCNKKQISIAITLPNNEAGSLYKVLAFFDKYQIDLNKIESRPLKTSLGQYYFVIDFIDNKDVSIIDSLFNDIIKIGSTIKFFGKYNVYLLEDE